MPNHCQIEHADYIEHTNVLPDHVRQSALSAFPGKEWDRWHAYSNGKLATVDPIRIPTACRLALEMISVVCPPISGFFDHEYHGAGLHLMPAGSRLGRHIDADSHPIKNWRRTGSLVYFLEDCDGGELVINKTVVKPRKNTAIMLYSGKWHEVIKTEKDRKTLALFSWEITSQPKGNTSAVFA